MPRFLFVGVRKEDLGNSPRAGKEFTTENKNKSKASCVMSEDEEWHDASSKTCLVYKRNLFFYNRRC